jgi:hypothetical protein
MTAADRRGWVASASSRSKADGVFASDGPAHAKSATKPTVKVKEGRNDADGIREPDGIVIS